MTSATYRDDRERHLAALLDEVAALREQNAGLQEIAAHRDALLQSPTWRIGVAVIRPLQRIRRLGR